jgi:hydroxymethylpyrimidine pyrophosphatase-like HAD family hydrolase
MTYNDRATASAAIGILLTFIHLSCLYNKSFVISFSVRHRRSQRVRGKLLYSATYRQQRQEQQLNLSLQSDSENLQGKSDDDTLSYGKIKQPGSSKMDLYSSEDLMSLLDIHQSLTNEVPDFSSRPPSSSAGTSTSIESIMNEQTNILSLQDLIVQTVQDIEKEFVSASSPATGDVVVVSQGDESVTVKQPSEQSEMKTLQFQSSLSEHDLIQKIRAVRAIVSDVDGTLLGRDHTLHPITEQAIRNAVEASYSPISTIQYFFPATGKTRSGALNSLGFKMKSVLQQSPGVYVQGLYCLDTNGKVVFEKKLTHIAIEQVEVLMSTQSNITLLAYDGDNIYVNGAMSHPRHVNDVSNKWGEPCPIVLHTPFSTYEPSFHKILLMGDDAEIMSSIVRPQLEGLASSLDCVVTQAIPTMLELLPGGCSKALGVQ